MSRWAWAIAAAVAMTAGCQSLPQPYEGAAADAQFLFGGKWEQKEEPAQAHEGAR
jgi:hypothetical protein